MYQNKTFQSRGEARLKMKCLGRKKKNWCERISKYILKYQMFPILRVKRRLRLSPWGRKNEMPFKGERKQKKELMAPLHEFSQFKHVYLYLWTNGCYWSCVQRMQKQLHTEAPFQKPRLPLPSSGGSKEVHQPVSWSLGMPI